MLKELSVNNIVLISSLNIEFKEGLTVLTGETGAGKSILLDALALCLGVRAESGLIRKDEDKASVTAVFDKSVYKNLKPIFDEFETDFNTNEDLILKRVLTKDGSKAYINDTPATIKFLSKLGNAIAEIHGQFENHGLMNSASHIAFLDNFAENQILIKDYQESFFKLKNLQNKLNDLLQNLDEKKKQEEYLRHCIAEIEKLNPSAGEEDELTTKRRTLMLAEKNADVIKDAYAAFNKDDKANANIKSCLNILSRAGGESMADLVDKLASLNDEIVYINDELESILRNQKNPVEELEKTEERLFAIKGLARKHQVLCDELPKFLSKLKTELNDIVFSDEMIFKYQKEIQEFEKETKEKANKLHESRTNAAKNFDNAISEELIPLKLEKARFATQIKEKELGLLGNDEVQFTVSMNPGQPFVALNKTASGGELVRLMLAVKVILKSVNPTPIMIFDEVDTGISGSTSSAVGTRLQRLGSSVQVIAITHSAQVASCGNNHFKILKSEKDGKTFTSLKEINDDERLNEIARLLSAEQITETSLNLAKELLNK